MSNKPIIKNDKYKEKKRIISFPRMGNLSIPVKSVLTAMGAEVLLSPPNNKQTLTLGTRYSTETVCLPYKMNLGNYIQALEAGANVLIMFQAPGTCRLGNYASSAESKLRELGYEFEMIVFDMYKGKLKEIVNKFSLACGGANIVDILNAVRLGFAKFDALDKIERELFYYRPREIERGNSENIYYHGRKLIDETMSVSEVKKITASVLNKYRKIQTDNKKEILKVYLTGEFYVLLDPFTNMEVEKELGLLGVEVERQIMLSDWTNNILKPKWMNKTESHRERAFKIADSYITRAIGGECLESIGDTVHAAKTSGIDGVVHIGPFTCNPETVSQCILPRVSREEDIPVLSLTVDEHTGKAGIVTRLEAFVDLLARKKKARKTA